MAKRKILLIDDEKDLVDLVKSNLESNGYDVLIAFNGKQGLEKAMAEQPDLIILDIMMPVMDGFETLRKIRDDDRIKNTPIIMLTVKSETESIFKAEELGSTDYITKPFSLEELINLIKTYI